MNNKYSIKISSPLIRHGITIKTTCSEKYVVKVTNMLMEIVRELNSESLENKDVVNENIKPPVYQ